MLIFNSWNWKLGRGGEVKLWPQLLLYHDTSVLQCLALFKMQVCLKYLHVKVKKAQTVICDLIVGVL